MLMKPLLLMTPELVINNFIPEEMVRVSLAAIFKVSPLWVSISQVFELLTQLGEPPRVGPSRKQLASSETVKSSAYACWRRRGGRRS
jgi:hypothetical protein